MAGAYFLSVLLDARRVGRAVDRAAREFEERARADLVGETAARLAPISDALLAWERERAEVAGALGA